MPPQGQCNCGAISVFIKNDEAVKSTGTYCHCIPCRRQSGALGTYVTVISDEDVEVTGTPKAYQDTATDSGVTMQRWFCPNCGSPIMSTTPRAPGVKFIKMGLFDEIQRPVAEVYCKNKSDWEGSVEGCVSKDRS
ncbi:uncharacterized protein PV06_10032 [Exophiala oligosperma]|uniref:CENP-V/GFA domain-containing protein n=1 Tax=Exophiala oligosperma TaxID=215243 RepID=A0A0D2ACX3_9EURO|nr:uncharacterized protein PV06_10032 [Exophiala oligosperma]KIW38061.1 hypothetical protein PV06_10032 [Exophiala oligosperma]